MIFLKNDKIFAKVWKVDKKDKYTSLQISTGDKQQDGTYKYSSWSARLVGKAKDIAINENDRIVITSAKIENIHDKEKNKSWLNIIVFDFTNENNEGEFHCPGVDEVDELPWG